ncbi:hypothetical protein CH365_15490 [Leptospira neocaledonica]|uniref:Uncharacterized protein n=1 Tax=Leptospira neocaledonica TaxID=2023192 RepID=A0A2M9ZVY1_9LEPT|nr:hypothetical protein CH365_15490 [Leptospira neocaledonica]
MVELGERIKGGEIRVIDDNAVFFSEIREGFPQGFNRIDWSKIPHNFDSILPGNDFKEKLIYFVSDFLKKNNLTRNGPVIYFGDAIDIAFEISLTCFYSISDRLFAVPQHSYVIDKDVSWCFNHTFEDEMYIGRSKKSPFIKI